MTLADVRSDSPDGVVGRLLYREIVDVAARVVARYPAAVYSPGRQPRWDDDAVLEIVHECVLRHMRPDQITLLFGYARDMDSLRAMIGKRVRRTLLDVRLTDVVDNLLGRIRTELIATPGVVDRQGFLVLDDTSPREPTEAELAAAARLVSVVPQLNERPIERAPRVFGSESTTRVARALLTGLPGGVSRRALDRVLRDVLTHRRVAALVPEVEAAEVAAHDDGDPAVEEVVESTVDSFLATLSPDQRGLVRQILDGWTDGQIAEFRGSSRPAAHAARTRIVAVLRPLVIDVQPDLADRVVVRLYERLIHE